MLTPTNKQLQGVFERILEDKNGVLMRVRFMIVEVNGVFAPQIISATPLISQVEEKVICLPCTKDSKIVVEDVTLFFVSKFSPYVNLDFFMSQPTRAPSYR